MGQVTPALKTASASKNSVLYAVPTTVMPLELATL
jgi:hypothetical protein